MPTKDITTTTTDSGGKSKVSYEDVRQQVTNYSQQINEYLEKVGARLDSYKFDVLKVPKGISLDIAFKATFTKKNNNNWTRTTTTTSTRTGTSG